MTIVQGGTSGVGADVGPVSKGLYQELVDAVGRKLAPTDCYSAFIDVTPTTALADGTAYWFMRNTGARIAVVKRISMILGFTGTAGLSMSSYRWERFATATPTGGTAIVPVKQKNSNTATTVSAGFLSTGLTVGAATFESSFWRVAHLNQLVAIPFDLDLTDLGEGPNLELNTGEGLILRANGAVVAGTRAVGGVFWGER